jgi:hypothetical protein
MLNSFSGRTMGKILIVAALALLVAAVAQARTTAKIVATGYIYENSGGKLLAVEGTALNPKSLSAKIVSKPSQKLILKWAVSCSKGAPAQGGEDVMDPSTTQKSGQKSMTTPGSATLPVTVAKAKRCTVTAYAYLTKKANRTTKIQVIQT